VVAGNIKIQPHRAGIPAVFRGLHLCARGAPSTRVAEWAGHSVNVILRVCAKCVCGQDQVTNARLETGADRGRRREPDVAV